MPFIISLLLIVLSMPQSAHATANKNKSGVQSNGNIAMLVLDIDNDGIKMMSNTKRVYWDIDMDGFAEATDWIDPSDAIFAIDVNDNRNIEKHKELFGNEKEEGFKKLSFHDDNSDGQITKSDQIWPRLYLWFDKNTDGYSQKEELISLSDYDITSISIPAPPNKNAVPTEQTHKSISLVIATPPGSPQKEMQLRAIYPVYNDTNTVYNEDFDLDVRALFMPTLRGYGNLPALHIAVSKDSLLLEKVKNLAVINFDQFLSANNTVEEDFENILYRWADVENLESNSRGPNIDARRLAFLEVLTAEPFIQVGAGGTPNPLPKAALHLREAYKAAFQNLYSHFMIQLYSKELFSNQVSYDPVKDRITVSQKFTSMTFDERFSKNAAPLPTKRTPATPRLNRETLEELISRTLHLDEASKLEIWTRYVRVLNYHDSFNNMETEEFNALSESISTAMQGAETLQTILDTLNAPLKIPEGAYKYLEHPRKTKKNFFIKHRNAIMLGSLTVLLFLLATRRKRRSAKQ